MVVTNGKDQWPLAIFVRTHSPSSQKDNKLDSFHCKLLCFKCLFVVEVCAIELFLLFWKQSIVICHFSMSFGHDEHTQFEGLFPVLLLKICLQSDWEYRWNAGTIGLTGNENYTSSDKCWIDGWWPRWWWMGVFVYAYFYHQKLFILDCGCSLPDKTHVNLKNLPSLSSFFCSI